VEDVKKLKLQVAVFGPNDCKRDSWMYLEAWKLGTMLARAGYVVMTGGLPYGVMEAVTLGCLSKKGETLGVGFKGEEASMMRSLSRTRFAPNLTQRLGDLMAADAFISFAPNSSQSLLELLTANEMQHVRLRNSAQRATSGVRPVLLLDKYYGATTIQLKLFIREEDNFISVAKNSSEAINCLKEFFQANGK
jgi:hypothetical protein